MSNADRLDELIRFEIANFHAEFWRYAFPCQVAAWKYIAERHPEVLGEFRGGFDTEPYFQGRGADWFVDTWENSDQYWSLLDAILRPVVDATAHWLRENGFLTSKQVPALERGPVAELAELLDAEAERARR